MNGWKATIGINGFTMVFGLANHWYQWFCNGLWSGNYWYQWFFDGFVVQQPLDPMVFQWFSMEANNWWNGNDPSPWSTLYRERHFCKKMFKKCKRMSLWWSDSIDSIHTTNFQEKIGSFKKSLYMIRYPLTPYTASLLKESLESYW